VWIVKPHSLFLLFVVLSGCSTYSRQGQLSDFEKNTMNCREIDDDIVRVRRFMDKTRSGFGNTLEKMAALDSGNKRLEQLAELRARRACPAQKTAS
jgi:archaellum component FlaC